MEDSLFAAMRIVAMMLGIDRKIDPNERKWFLAVLNTFGANHSQRLVLRKDLNCKYLDELDSIFQNVTEQQDRARLINLLRVAMNSDGVITATEKEFFERIKRLNDNPQIALIPDYDALGKAVIQHEKEIQLWKSLGEVGKTFAQVQRFPYMRMHYPVDLWDYIFIFESLASRRSPTSQILVLIFGVLLFFSAFGFGLYFFL